MVGQLEAAMCPKKKKRKKKKKRMMMKNKNEQFRGSPKKRDDHRMGGN